MDEYNFARALTYEEIDSASLDRIKMVEDEAARVIGPKIVEVLKNNKGKVLPLIEEGWSKWEFGKRYHMKVTFYAMR